MPLVQVHCAKYANEIGMALDVTMGSGWPGGHNKVTKADAEKQLLMEKVGSPPGLEMRRGYASAEAAHRTYSPHPLINC